MKTGNEIYFLARALSDPPMLNVAELYEGPPIKPIESRPLQRHIATAAANRPTRVLTTGTRRGKFPI